MFKVAKSIRTLTTIAAAVAAGAIIWGSVMSPITASADGDVLDHEGDRVFTLTNQINLAGAIFDEDGNPVLNMGVFETPDLTGVVFDEEGDAVYTQVTVSSLSNIEAGLDHEGDRVYTLETPDLSGIEMDHDGDAVYTPTSSIDLDGVAFDEDGDPIWISIR